MKSHPPLTNSLSNGQVEKRHVVFKFEQNINSILFAIKVCFFITYSYLLNFRERYTDQAVIFRVSTLEIRILAAMFLKENKKKK